jgi:hypothetical protein
LSHREQEASLRQKLDDINEAIKPLVSGKCGERRMAHNFEYKNTSLGSLRNEEVKIGEYERDTEQARVEAGARYMDWKNPPKAREEKLAVSFRKTLLRRVRQDRQDPPDYEKSFNEAGEFSKILSSYHLRSLSEKSFVECVGKLNPAHSSFKESLSKRSEAC